MVRDLPMEERPRERILAIGTSQASHADLIAILLRTGTTNESVLSLADRVLVQTGGIRGLAEMTLDELIGIHGIGPAKAVQLLAGVELGRRIARIQPEERYKIRCPHDAADYVMEEMRYLKQEHFVCLLLDTKHQILGKKTIFVGTLNASIVHPREVFREGIRRGVAAVICLHNHPSGDPTPSREDIQITHRLAEAGEVLGIPLLDHVVIGDQTYYSMKEKGILSS
ncbi:DNA repair protein RadC [Mechercharimyces sp. CAU 1602]|uniref:RadC family protein n=1 Tax=Mechercharimyces sp. CAU 1602 TaxID=2973933 RepID=UPI0021639AEF|nr:DNA repair protein RadC [Mechercharimyces sp. CAU 1602]MCS1351435.1 DNA repair protein RadC [Mechercharimyces sp. CAU 1602]